MNLKSIKKVARVVDYTIGEKLKTKVFKMIEKFVYKYKTHYYPHYTGGDYDLTLDIFEEFCRPKKHRNGEVFSELERMDPSKVGGGQWKGDEDSAIATYVQRYVIARLIDKERTDKREATASENYDEKKPGLTLDRAAHGGKGGSDESEVSSISVGGGAYTATGMNDIVELLDDPANWSKAKKIFAAMSEDQKKHIARLFKLVKKDLDPKVTKFMETLLATPQESSQLDAADQTFQDLEKDYIGMHIQKIPLKGQPAIRVTFDNPDARKAVDEEFDDVKNDLSKVGYDFEKEYGGRLYFLKRAADSFEPGHYVVVDPANKVHRVKDTREFVRSTVYGPFPKYVADSVEMKLRAIYDTEVPKIKNSKDLYDFAEKLGLPYLNEKGKPKSTDTIKQMIAEYLWEEEHPGEEMPPQIAPQLINDITAEGKEYVDKTFTKDKWYLQNKINGMRFILVLNPDGSTHMTSRDRSVKTFRYSELDDRVLGLQNLKSPFEKRTILDGEIICENPSVTLPSGITTTSTLQSTVALMHMKPEQSIKVQQEIGSLTYKVFDILELNGENVEKLPYEERAELTATACQKINEINPNSAIDPLPVIKDYESAWDLFQEYVNNGGEGMILKSRTAPYEQGKRTKGQWKLKGFVGIDAYVTGFTPSSDDKQFADLIGGLVFSTNYKGKEVEIAAISNIPLDVRKAATAHDENGNVILNPAWYGKVAEIVGQNFKEGSFRLGSARINEWRDDKKPEDCELLESQIKYDR